MHDFKERSNKAALAVTAINNETATHGDLVLHDTEFICEDVTAFRAKLAMEDMYRITLTDRRGDDEHNRHDSVGLNFLAINMFVD